MKIQTSSRSRYRKRLWVTGGIVALGLLGAVFAQISAQNPSGFGVRPTLPGGQAAEKVRKIAHEPGRGLVERLRPSDETLEVVDERPAGLPPPPPPPGYPGSGQSYLQRTTESRSVILLVRVESQKGALNAARDWVDNTIRADVVEVSKNATDSQISEGDSIALSARGGDVGVGKQRIRAFRHDEELLANGATYLVFAGEPRAGVFPTVNADWLRVEGELLVPTTGTGKSLFGLNANKAATLNDISTYALVKK